MAMKIEPVQAVNMLDEVASKYHGTRQDHVNLQAALSCLRQMVDENEALRKQLAEFEILGDAHERAEAGRGGRPFAE